MPLGKAVYDVLISRAKPACYTDYQIEWELPLAKGNAIIHAARVLDGEAMIWPDPQLSEKGRWWEQVVSWIKKRRKQREEDARE